MPMQQVESDSYTITLKNEKIRFYKIIALLFVLLHVIIYIFLLIVDVHFYEAAAALVLAGLYVMYYMYAAKKSDTPFFINEFIFFILAGSWVALQNYLAAFGCIILGVLYHLSLQKLQFVFLVHSVKKMNFPSKEYSWQSFTNVLIRDKILTLDFKNNSLIQLEAENDINETQFNEFAKSRLNAFSNSMEKKL